MSVECRPESRSRFFCQDIDQRGHNSCRLAFGPFERGEFCNRKNGILQYHDGDLKLSCTIQEAYILKWFPNHTWNNYHKFLSILQSRVSLLAYASPFAKYFHCTVSFSVNRTPEIPTTRRLEQRTFALHPSWTHRLEVIDKYNYNSIYNRLQSSLCYIPQSVSQQEYSVIVTCKMNLSQSKGSSTQRLVLICCLVMQAITVCLRCSPTSPDSCS